MTPADMEALEARARNGFAHPEDVRALIKKVRLLQSETRSALNEIQRLKEELRSARLTLVSRMEQGSATPG